MSKEENRGKRILLVEDECHIAEGLLLNLQLSGYEVKWADSGTAGLSAWKHWSPDLVVLDIMLPGVDGFSVLRSIRQENERLPVLILSAKNAPEDRVKGLEWGSDDYLSKPFNLDEFLLRVDRLLKRDSWQKQSSVKERTELVDQYQFGENYIDFTQAVAQCKGKTISLTEQELRLLRLFIANRGKTLSRGDILELAWGFSKSLTTRTVDNFVARFRKYFEEDPKHPRFFKSRRSVGYVFDH
jgi:DNA-binding response OmpR family regulator